MGLENSFFVPLDIHKTNKVGHDSHSTKINLEKETRKDSHGQHPFPRTGIHWFEHRDDKERAAAIHAQIGHRGEYLDGPLSFLEVSASSELDSQQEAGHFAGMQIHLTKEAVSTEAQMRRVYRNPSAILRSWRKQLNVSATMAKSYWRGESQRWVLDKREAVIKKWISQLQKARKMAKAFKVKSMINKRILGKIAVQINSVDPSAVSENMEARYEGEQVNEKDGWGTSFADTDVAAEKRAEKAAEADYGDFDRLSREDLLKKMKRKRVQSVIHRIEDALSVSSSHADDKYQRVNMTAVMQVLEASVKSMNITQLDDLSKLDGKVFEELMAKGVLTAKHVQKINAQDAVAKQTIPIHRIPDTNISEPMRFYGYNGALVNLTQKDQKKMEKMLKQAKWAESSFREYPHAWKSHIAEIKAEKTKVTKAGKPKIVETKDLGDGRKAVRLDKMQWQSETDDSDDIGKIKHRQARKERLNAKNTYLSIYNKIEKEHSQHLKTVKERLRKLKTLEQRDVIPTLEAIRRERNTLEEKAKH